MEESTFKQMSDNAVQFLLGRLHLFCRDKGFDWAFIRGNSIVGHYRNDDREFEEENRDLIEFFRYFSKDTDFSKMWSKEDGWV